MADAGLPFALSSYQSGSNAISGQQIINFYCEVQREGMDAKTPAALIGTPGLVAFSSPGAGPIRAALEMNDIFYCVSGTQLYTINSSGTETLLGGGIAPGSDVIGIAGSGTQIVIVDGTNGFTYTPATLTYAQISDLDFNRCKTVTYLNGYFIFDWYLTNKFFSSAANDGTSYDALFFSSAETSPDNVHSVFSHQQQLFIAGKKGIEIWQFNANTSAFPWVRYPGASIQIGTAGPLAVAVHKENVFYVGSDSLFYQLNGVEPVNRSDPGVAAAWKAYGDISDVVVWGMDWGIQQWIVITFPAANKTWVFDAHTGFFHERVSHDSSGVSLSRWRANVYAKCYGKHLIGDAYSDQVGYMDGDVFAEYGNIIQSRAVAPAMHDKGNAVFMQSLEILAKMGVGLTSGQGSAPKIILDWSDDGGGAWSTVQMEGLLGAIGETTARLRFTELGSFYSRNYRITMTDPVRRVIISAIPKAASGLSYA